MATLAGTGCGSSHDSVPPGDGGDGGGDRGDAVVTIDVQEETRPDLPPPECGNGTVERMEQCDDGDTDPGDGCDAMCRREPYCGDGNMGGDEVCDDGNNRSADGCRSDCGSDETCGNGIVDIAVGESCDDDNTDPGDGCSADCQTVESCGDGAVNAANGETCDDGDTVAWDGCTMMSCVPGEGCGPDCRNEITLVIDSLQIGSPMEGCDYSGDGRPDNSFSRALGLGVPLLNGMINAGDLNFLMHFMGLDDVTGSTDSSMTVAWIVGVDADMDPTNNLSGMGQFFVPADAFGAGGRPTTAFYGGIAAHALTAGPEDVSVAFGLFDLDLSQGRLSGTTVASSGRLSSLSGGRLCGVVSVATLANIPLAGLPIMLPPPCGGGGGAGSFADLLVGGATIFTVSVGGIGPDVDLDGDGLEYFETVTGDGCVGVITACIDGDGTRIEGDGCATALDGEVDRFVDGYSAGFPITATSARIVGVAP